MPIRLKDYGRNHKKRKEYIKQSGLLLVEKWGHYVASLVMLRLLDILPFKYQKYIFFAFNSYT